MAMANSRILPLSTSMVNGGKLWPILLLSNICMLLTVSAPAFDIGGNFVNIVSGLEDGVVKGNYPIGTNLRRVAAWPRPRATARPVLSPRSIGLPRPCIVGGWACPLRGRVFWRAPANRVGAGAVRGGGGGAVAAPLRPPPPPPPAPPPT